MQGRSEDVHHLWKDYIRVPTGDAKGVIPAAIKVCIVFALCLPLSLAHPIVESLLIFLSSLGTSIRCLGYAEQAENTDPYDCIC